MRKRIEIQEGQKFGRLTIIKEIESQIRTNNRKRRFVLVKCDCGKEYNCSYESIKYRNSTSCGCFKLEEAKKIGKCNVTHGDTTNDSKYKYLVSTWHSMRYRCYKPLRKEYKDYGGRGIVVEKYFHNYINFRNWILDNLGHRPIGMSLDRIDNNENYDRNNLRWATKKQQANNRR